MVEIGQEEKENPGDKQSPPNRDVPSCPSISGHELTAKDVMLFIARRAAAKAEGLPTVVLSDDKAKTTLNSSSESGSNKVKQITDKERTKAFLNPSFEKRELQDKLAKSIPKKDGENSWEAEHALLNYQGYLRTHGDSALGAQILEQMLGIEQHNKEPGYIQAGTCGFIAAALTEAGNTKEASDWNARSEALRLPNADEQKLQDSLAKSIANDPNSANTHGVFKIYQNYLKDHGRNLEAAQMLEKMLGIEQHNNMPGSVQAATCKDIAAALSAVGRTKEASCWNARAEALRNPSAEEQYFQTNLAKSRSTGETGDTHYLLTKYNDYLQAHGRNLEGAQVLQQALAIEQQNKWPGQIMQAAARQCIADAFHAAGRYGDAQIWMLKAGLLKNK